MFKASVKLKFIFCISLLTVVFLTLPKTLEAATWQYTISPADTPTTIDAASTSAVVDTVNYEITLPKSLAHAASFWPDGSLNYVVMAPNKVAHYSFNGSTMSENTVLSVNLPSNPLAVAAPDPYPDVVVAMPDKLYHYSFNGSGMSDNPALGVAGLANAVSIGVRGSSEAAGLVTGQLKHFMFGGSSMVEVPALEPSGLVNPIDFALMPDGFDVAVLEQNQVRYFQFTGSGLSENTALNITGLTAPKAVASAGGDLTVIDGTQVKHYSFSGSGFVYNSALSVTSGLANPTCVAVRPGTYDRIIVDGNNVKYFSWDGSQLTYNSSLSVTVAGLANMGSYSSSAQAVSQAKNPGSAVTYVRVRAYHELPQGTSVTWSVTADGTNYVKKWRVTGLAGGSTMCEVTNDNGLTWSSIGDASQATPAVNRSELWAQVNSGTGVRWKAELATANSAVTPKIKAPVSGNAAVVWETDSAPNPPVINTSGTCYTTSTPTFTWTFSDPDTGDSQSAYQVVIRKKSDSSVVYDSGRVTSGTSSFTVPTSTSGSVPGTLWSSGEYQFTVQARVWDQAGVPSNYSSPADFCVVAFDRPRVAEIVSPPPGQTAPDPDDPSTHIVITQGMAESQLPRVKAGAKVKLLFDSIGPLTSASADFPYLSQHSTIGSGPTGTYPSGNKVNRWEVEFWTDASLEVCPDGTVVGMLLTGPAGGAGTAVLSTPSYSAGVVKTQGSVYEDWFVVLQGRD